MGAVTKCWVFGEDRTQPFQIPETVSFLKRKTTLGKSGWEVALAVWGEKKHLSWCPATPCFLPYLAFTTECGPQASNNPFNLCSFPPEKGAVKRRHLQRWWCNQLASLVMCPFYSECSLLEEIQNQRSSLRMSPASLQILWSVRKAQCRIKIIKIPRMLRWMPRCFLLESSRGVCGRREQQSLGTAYILGQLEWGRRMGLGFCALCLMYYSLLGADCFWLHASPYMWRGRLH